MIQSARSQANLDLKLLTVHLGKFINLFKSYVFSFSKYKMIESKGRQIINGLSFNSKIALHHCFAKGLFFKGASENTKDKTFPKVMILMDFAIRPHPPPNIYNIAPAYLSKFLLLSFSVLPVPTATLLANTTPNALHLTFPLSDTLTELLC